VKFKSVRILAAIAAKLGLEAYQDDVPTAFLKGKLEEEIWMEQPKGYEIGEVDMERYSEDH
jgi:Reverse transcriptase (RNA-dependent DNA polymerase)